MDLSCLAFVPLCLALLNHSGDAPYSDHGKRVHGTAQSPTGPTKDGSLAYMPCDAYRCAYTWRNAQNLTGEDVNGAAGHVTGGRPIAAKGGAAAAFAGGMGSH